MTKADDDHIAVVGKETFHRARVAAFIGAANDSRLTGATELRSQIAHEAALRATGAKHKRPIPPFGRAGNVYGGTQALVDEVIASCTEKARATLAPED